MPELPEVENVRLTLEQAIRHHRVTRVQLLRRDIVCGSTRPSALLSGAAFTHILRHGKQLALIARALKAEPCLCIHLGMSGSLRYFEASIPIPGKAALIAHHVHIVWHLHDGGWLAFTDPRRFGGLWTFADLQTLEQTRWARLGPDALSITTRVLHSRLGTTSRPLKTALLDQHLIAGLGNIYVDELLHACKLHPCTPAAALTFGQVRTLTRCMKSLLRRAVRSGGSTLRNYIDAAGRRGRFQFQHHVYGRAGQSCRTCHTPLTAQTLAGRTTVHCPTCQTIPFLKDCHDE